MTRRPVPDRSDDDPRLALPALDVARFWTKVEIVGRWTECWAWVGLRTESGYGRFFIDGKNRRAHRVAYELLVGAIPEGLVLDHLCRNRACVNPDHLEPVTVRENTLRGEGYAAKAAAKTHCKRGHEYTAENTRRNGRGTRGCRACERDQARRRRTSR